MNKLDSNLKGTEFEIAVWKEIAKIPYGQTRTYKEVAIAIGKSNSSRAVANACGKNPYAPDVPCHRVIRSDGLVGGYSGHGGKKRKKELLQKEGLKF
tara:strand:+ start:1319 stop:1609 length:291 start_codon:yes stop_codon:yes gene_type:complete